MKVLLLNGSPNQHGCTHTALCEVARAIEESGIETEILWIGNSGGSRLHRLRRLRQKRQTPLRLRRRSRQYRAG